MVHRRVEVAPRLGFLSRIHPRQKIAFVEARDVALVLVPALAFGFILVLVAILVVFRGVAVQRLLVAPERRTTNEREGVVVSSR